MKLFLCMIYTELFINLFLCHWLIVVFSSRFYFWYIIAMSSNLVLSSLSLHGQFSPKYSQWTPIAHPWRRYSMSSICAKSVPCSTCRSSAIRNILLYWLLLQCFLVNIFIYFLLTHLCPSCDLIYFTPTLKWLDHFFVSKWDLIFYFFIHQCNILIRKWFKTMNV